jgi:tetratricopeptide (TPR) repeat protein
MDLSLGRFALAQETAEKFLKRRPQSARAYFTIGEACRQRNQKGDVEKAEQHYRRAIEIDASYAPPHRGLGLIWLKQGRKKQAREAFEKYLSLAPQAEDKGYIQQYLQDLPSSEANPS